LDISHYVYCLFAAVGNINDNLIKYMSLHCKKSKASCEDSELVYSILERENHDHQAELA
jgi:hypothetical protein